MGLLLANSTDRFVSRDALVSVPTPAWTPIWHPVPHIDVVRAVESAVLDNGCFIDNERFGLSREGQKMFGVLTLARRSNPEWAYAVGIRNSHDQSFAAGICCGVSVLVCSNLCFGGEFVLKRRHTSGIDVREMATQALGYLTDGFLSLEERLEQLQSQPIPSDDWARCLVVRSAELGVIPSCDILPVINEYFKPRHEEFSARTCWSLINAFSEISHKYPAAKADNFHRKLTRLFGLDGKPGLVA